jgi:hypothetical protein
MRRFRGVCVYRRAAAGGQQEHCRGRRIK